MFHNTPAERRVLPEKRTRFTHITPAHQIRFTIVNRVSSSSGTALCLPAPPEPELEPASAPFVIIFAAVVDDEELPGLMAEVEPPTGGGFLVNSPISGITVASFNGSLSNIWSSSLYA